MKEKLLRFMAGRYGMDQSFRQKHAAVVLRAGSARVLLCSHALPQHGEAAQGKRLLSSDQVPADEPLSELARPAEAEKRLLFFPLPGLQGHAACSEGRGTDPGDLPQMRQRV